MFSDMSVALTSLAKRMLEEEEDGEEDRNEDAKTTAKVWAVLVVCVIALELTLEALKDFTFEKVPPSAKIIVQHIFAELAVVGGVSLVLFMITTQSDWLDEISVYLYGEEEDEMLEEILEQVHYALFFLVIAFWIFGFLLILFLERLRRKQARDDLHALDAEKLVENYESKSGTLFGRTLTSSKAQYLAMRTRVLENLGLHQNFDFARYLEVRGLDTVGEIAEIQMGSWLLLLIMLLPIWVAWLTPVYFLESHMFIAAIIGSQYVFTFGFWAISRWLVWIVHQCTPPYFKVGTGKTEKIVRVCREPTILERTLATVATVCRCVPAALTADDSLVMRILSNDSAEEMKAPSKVGIAPPRYLFTPESVPDIREYIHSKYGVLLAPKIIDELRNIFNQFDADRSGQLDEDEYKDLLLAEFPNAHNYWGRIRPCFMHLASNDGEVISFAGFVELHVLITTSPLSYICPPSSSTLARRSYFLDRLPHHNSLAYFFDQNRVPIKVESDSDKFDELFRMRFRTVLGGSYYFDLDYDRVVKTVQVSCLFNVCALAIILEVVMTHSNNTFYSDVELVIFLALVIAGVAWFTTVLLLELLPAMVTAFSIEDNIDREAIDKIDIDDRKHRLARALRVCAMIELHGKLHRASDSPSPSVTAEELRSVPSDKLAEWERDAIITFNAFDTDGTGGLSVNELEAKLAVFSGGGSMLAREVVAGCFDLSRDVVTLPMFLQFLLNAQLEEARSGSSLDHFLFSLLDRERRGKVSMARMQKIMHGIDSTVQEHDVNELILVADMKRTGSITFLDLQRLCRQYGDFPSIFTHISGAPSDGKERSDSTSLGEITDHEAKAHSNKLASILAWEGESRFGVATIDRKGRLVNRNLCTMEKSGTPSKPKSYLEGGHVLSWVDAESSMSTNAFRSPTKYQLDHLVSLGSAAVPESLSTTLTTQKFKEACESDPYVRSHGVQLVFKDTVLEFICESKEHCDMLLHGLPIMLNKTHIALVKPKEGAPVPKTAEETTTEAHDMAMSAIKDDDAKLLAKALDKGLDVNTITEGAKSLYDMAIEKNHQNCIELLRKRGAKLAEDMIGETEGDEEAKSNRPPVETLVRDALTLIDKQANARAHTFGRCSHVYMALSENRISVNKRVVEFRQGTSEITRDFELVLDEVAELINQSQNVFKEWRIPPVKVWIEGHTNGALNRDEVWHVHTSSERARNVVSELSKRNVNTDYLFAKGFGCEKPIYDTSGTLAPLNSRVDFVFQIPDSWMRLLPVRMDDAERQGVAGLSAESNGEAKDWKEADATQLMLEGRAGDIDEGGSLAVQFESICPNLCLYQTASTKAAGGMGSFSKGFYVLGAPNTDISTPIQTAGGVASLDTDVPPDSKIPWAIKYVAANKRIQQFFGNYVPVRSGQVIKMSMWIKCIDTVPAPSPKFGFAHSHPPGCDNAWLSQLEPNEWKHVTTSYEADETGLDFLMLQLDGVPNETELLFADLQYVVKDVLSIELEPTPKESQQRGASNTSVGKLANKRVRVVGTSQADLNDSAGVALSYDAQKGRYIVKLRNGRQLALKEQNLVAL